MIFSFDEIYLQWKMQSKVKIYILVKDRNKPVKKTESLFCTLLNGALLLFVPSLTQFFYKSLEGALTISSSKSFQSEISLLAKLLMLQIFVSLSLRNFYLFPFDPSGDMMKNSLGSRSVNCENILSIKIIFPLFRRYLREGNLSCFKRALQWRIWSII